MVFRELVAVARARLLEIDILGKYVTWVLVIWD